MTEGLAIIDACDVETFDSDLGDLDARTDTHNGSRRGCGRGLKWRRSVMNLCPS